MNIANFTITKKLNQKIGSIVKDQGFSSKAEFFRFAIYCYINNLGHKKSGINNEYKVAMEELSTAISKKFKNQKSPSLGRQLADLK